MSQIVKLRRSAVEGKIPSTGSLELGELAVNTTDGKAYLKKDDGTESIQSLVTTDSITTGSIFISGSMTLTGSFNISGSINNVKQINFDTIDGETLDEGQLGWNSSDGTLNLGLNGGEVTLQIGQEQHYYVRNQSGEDIENGSVVYKTGVSGNKLLIDKFVADDSVNFEAVLGLATQDIPDNSNGYVTSFGYVRDIDTSMFQEADFLYAHPTISGSLTTQQPSPPSQSIFIGFVTNASTSGSINVNPHVIQKASDTPFYNSGSNLESTNVGGALRELDNNKASVEALSSNIYFYSTNATSSVDSSYFRLVTSQDDSDYPDTAVNIPTGTISGSNQFIAKLMSDDNIISGNPGTISITTFGQIRKISGALQSTADFYFEVYKRSGSLEELVATSNTTNEVSTLSFQQFTATAILTPTSFSLDDRVVLRYYGSLIDDQGTDPSFEFQFGGGQPVTTLFPVPISVVPSDAASDTLVDTNNFNGILSNDDTNVQLALETLDDHSHTLQNITNEGNTTSANINVGGINVDAGLLFTNKTTNRVGINTTSPSSSLDVIGTISGSSIHIKNNAEVDGDLTVGGRITAEEFYTEYVSSSIIFESGSTKFGDTSDDKHEFTGSLQVNGSVTASTVEGVHTQDGVEILDTALAYAIALG